MNFVRNESLVLHCHQHAYVHDLLIKWNMKDANPTKLTGQPESYKSSLERREQAKKDERPQHEVDAVRKRAQALIGGILWLSTRTRPDVAYAVGHAASLAHDSPDEAFAHAKHLLRYIKGTMDYAMRLTPTETESSSSSSSCRMMLTTWTDASFAPAGDNSPTGVLVVWGGVAIAWRASRTHLNCQSVCEAELTAIQEGYMLAAGIREVLKSVGIDIGCIPVCTDNMAARDLAEEGGSWRTKHFAVKAEGIRQQVRLGNAEVRHVPGTEQKSDGLTKSLPMDKQAVFVEHCGLTRHPAPAAVGSDTLKG